MQLYHLLALAFCLTDAATDPKPAGVGPDQFANLLRSALSQCKDVTFLYEGNVEPVWESITKEQYDRNKEAFQGSYTWRSDASVFVDFYVRTHTVETSGRCRISVHGDKTVRFEENPDRGLPPIIVSHPYNLWVINDYSPHQMLWFWFYSLLKDPSAFNYRDLGWEEVDGRRCLVIQVNMSASAPLDKHPQYRFWVDLERGCHPLRVETLRFPPHVESRTEIQLDRFRTPEGKTIWLPISSLEGVFEQNAGEHPTKPGIIRTCKIVSGSVRINEGVADSFFNAAKKERTRGLDSLPLKREFDQLRADSPPPPKTDPASVEARLKEQLEEADRQSRMVEATSTARETWSSTSIFQVLFFAAGVVMITWAVVLLRRR